MKVKIIYGAPCSGKSTYVRNNASDSDLIFDYDRVLIASTNRILHLVEKHALHTVILDLREKYVEVAKNINEIETFYFICSRITQTVKDFFKDMDAEEILISATKEECYSRLNNDEARPDKDEWKKLIDDWFNDFDAESRQVIQMKNRFWNWIKDEESGSRELRLEGIIAEESWFGDEVTPKLFRQELYNGEGDITVWINSYGGDVFAASQIYTMLKSYPEKVTIKIDGIAASAASVCAMAGDEVLMSPTAALMIHDPSTITAGNVAELKAAIKVLNEVKETIINAYELKTGLPRDKLSDLMTAETWLNANKAVELGFCDKILFSDDKPMTMNAVMFSRMTVTNSLINKIVSKKKSMPDKTANQVRYENIFKKRRGF